MEKRFLAYDRQLEHLKQRGVAIGDSSAVVDILSRKSYYNIVNGYRRLFLDQSSIGDNQPYKSGTTLHELESLLIFDSDLRIVCLKRILGVELLVKSTIAYEFSGKYGTDDRKYLDPANFSTELPECRFVDKTLETVRYEKDRAQRDGNLSICHYMNKYECIPLWALINVLNFGTTVYFNYCMKWQDKLVAMKMFLHPSEFLQLTQEVAGLLGNLQDALITISIAEVKATMGLSEHWDDLLIT